VKFLLNKIMNIQKCQGKVWMGYIQFFDALNMWNFH
jgi:hypothetical protein